MHRFLIVIENAGENFSAYSPDLPGCVATGQTREETERRMYEAIQLHVDASWKTSNPFPRPRRSLSTSSFLPELTTRSTTRP